MQRNAVEVHHTTKTDMTRRILFPLSIILLLASTNACKKGENDPALPFKTRKGRLTGEWKVTAYTFSQTTQNGGATLAEESISYSDGGAWLQTDASGSELEYQLGNFTVQFNKDYTVSLNQSLTLVRIDTNDIAASSQVENSNNLSGSWSFVGRDDEGDWKNKERVFIEWDSFSTMQDDSTIIQEGYSGFASTEVWALDQLKNKEVIIKIESTTTDQNTGTTTTAMTTITAEKQ